MNKVVYLSEKLLCKVRYIENVKFVFLNLN